jgi:L-cystine transport system permease protein
MTIDYSFIVTAFWEELKVLPLTLLITIVPLFFGIIFGTVIALIRLYQVKYLHYLASFYVSFIRGTPMLLHIMIIYFLIPAVFDNLAAKYGWPVHSRNIPLLAFIFVSFTITASAYLSETIRSGILSVNPGQREAAYSVGMTTMQALSRIVLPQAAGNSIPMFCSAFISLLQGSSLAFFISVVEITAKAKIIANNNFSYVEAFIAAAIIYWGISASVEKISSMMEKRVQRYNRGGIA